MLSNKAIDDLCIKTSKVSIDPDAVYLRNQIKRETGHTYGFLLELYKYKDNLTSRGFRIKIQRAFDNYLASKIDIDAKFELHLIYNNPYNLDLIDFAQYNQLLNQVKEKEWLNLIGSLKNRKSLLYLLRFIHHKCAL